MHEYDDVETPFGQIVSSFEFRPTPTDEPERINYLNPFALLWWLSQISYDFYTFLSKALPARIGRTVFYTDEVFLANSPPHGSGHLSLIRAIVNLMMRPSKAPARRPPPTGGHLWVFWGCQNRP